MAEKINFAYLEEMAQGDQTVIQEMTLLFKSQVPELIEKLKHALEENDYDKLRETAHRAKSSVAIMGLNELSEQMKTLEEDAEQHTNAETYAEKIDLFERTCNQALNDIESLGY